MAEIKINLKDRKILFELDRNCRQSNSQIAKKVGLSKQVVNYRISRLEKQSIIKGYITQLNIPKFGFLSYKVMIQLQNVNPKKEQEITEHIQNNKNVHWLISCFGRWDLILAFSSKTAIDFNRALRKMLDPYEQFIKEKEILLITDLYNFSRAYLIDEKEKEVAHFGGQPEEIKIDDVDLEIIKILSENARKSIVEIADNLKITIDVIRYRIKKLITNKIIQSFRAVINKELLSYQYWNILVKTQHLTDEKEKQIIFFFEQTPNIIGSSKYMNNFDIGFEVEVKNINEFISE